MKRWKAKKEANENIWIFFFSGKIFLLRVKIFSRFTFASLDLF